VDTEQSAGTKFEQWLSLVGTIAAPVTILGALLFYFGYVSSASEYAYFDLSLGLEPAKEAPGRQATPSGPPCRERVPPTGNQENHGRIPSTSVLVRDSGPGRPGVLAAARPDDAAQRTSAQPNPGA
jgi:hypothetical protein